MFELEKLLRIRCGFLLPRCFSCRSTFWHPSVSVGNQSVIPVWNILYLARGEPRYHFLFLPPQVKQRNVMLTIKWPGWSSHACFFLGENRPTAAPPIRIHKCFLESCIQQWYSAPNLPLKQIPVENKKHRQGHCRVQRLRHIEMTLLDSSGPVQTGQSAKQRAFLAYSLSACGQVATVTALCIPLKASFKQNRPRKEAQRKQWGW